MREFSTFFKKELTESARTQKLLIMTGSFALLGVLNIISVEIMPKLMEMLAAEGINFPAAGTGALDAWVQFFKNVPQLGYILMTILFSGMLSREISRGTLINMLTKGLPRNVVIISKFTAATLIFTLSYWLCFAITYIYALVGLSQSGLSNIFLAAMCSYIFGIMLLSSLILGGALTKSFGGTLITAASLTGLLFFFNIFPAFAPFNPAWLISANIGIITGELPAADCLPPILTCLLITAALIISSLLIFKKRQLV